MRISFLNGTAGPIGLESGEELKGRLRKIAQGMQGSLVLVVGDAMLDRYLMGAIRRISPEAPVPILEVSQETLKLGGALNVAKNIVSLGGNVRFLGAIGQDEPGYRLKELALRSGIDSEGLIVENRRPTTLKTRLIAHSQQLVRFDIETRHPIARSTERRLLDRVKEALRLADAVVLSDYGKGTLTLKLCRFVLEESKSLKIPVFVDPKLRPPAFYRGAFCITPNLKEALELTRVSSGWNGAQRSLELAGRGLIKRFECEYALVTRSESGMSLFLKDGSHVHIPTRARIVHDVTGAGDTAVAVLALSVASGASMLEATLMANMAAGAVVGKLGTESLTFEELEGLIDGELFLSEAMEGVSGKA